MYLKHHKFRNISAGPEYTQLKGVVWIKKFPVSAWKMLKEEAEKFLGEEFWTDLYEIMPNFGPRIDMYNTEELIVVVIELPGIDSPEQVAINLMQGHILQIRGQVEPDYPLERRYIVQSERFFGEFDKKVQLPEQVSTQEVKATFRQGLLIIYLTKQPDKGSQRISPEFSDDNPDVKV